MRIPGLYRAKRLFWSARQWLLRPAVVLLYHRIAELPSDPWVLSVTPKHFAQHLEVLRASGLRLTSIPELLSTSSRREQTAAITFDDGYADNFETAAPILNSTGTPAMFYIATGQIGRNAEFWWDELDRLVVSAPRLPHRITLRANEREWKWRLDGISEHHETDVASSWRGWHPPQTGRQRVYRELYEILVTLDARAREDALRQVRSWSADSGAARPSHRVMSWDELRQLASHRDLQIGAHTVNHVSLSGLGEFQQTREIEHSKRMLQEQLGIEVRHFSYPYGSKANYDSRTISILKSLGFESACSNFVGSVTASTDRFQIPRIYIEDWDGDEFGRRLCLQSSRVYSLPRVVRNDG